MGTRVQAALAVMAALGLHGAALALIAGPLPSGAVAAGDGGADLVTLAPVSGDLTALVAAWETPPTVAPAPEPPPLPETPTAPTPLAMPDLPPASSAPPAPPKPVPAEAAPPPPDAPPPPPAEKPKPKPEAPKPQPRPEPPKPAPQPAATAQGTGGSGAAGQSGQAQAGTASSAGQEEALAAWGADIRARIERRKTYPRGADGATGTVTLVITVSPRGQLLGASVAASSGHDALDAAALKAVKNAGRLPRAPAGVAADGHSFRFRLRFER